MSAAAPSADLRRTPRRPADAADPAASARLGGCTCARVRRLARRVTQVYDRALAPIGLRVTQFSLMSHLIAHGDSAIAPLAAALDMDRTTLTRNLKPLIDAGLVDLSTNAEDGRVRVVRLTAAGKVRQRAAFRRWRQAQDTVDALLGTSEVTALHRLFDSLILTFNRAASTANEAMP